MVDKKLYAVAVSRVLKECKNLKDEGGIGLQDAKDFAAILGELVPGRYDNAAAIWSNMDTAARDDFVDCFTNNYLNKDMVAYLAEALKFEVIN